MRTIEWPNNGDHYGVTLHEDGATLFTPNGDLLATVGADCGLVDQRNDRQLRTPSWALGFIDWHIAACVSLSVLFPLKED